jgi:hypothetical protein
VSADEVALTITADGPIDRVSAPGIHGAQVEGAHARLVVARWGGDLPLEAVLEGGAVARATADSDGSRTIHLVTVPTAAPLASSAPAASAPSTSAPAPATTHVTAHPSHPPAPARPGGELHANPYAQ